MKSIEVMEAKFADTGQNQLEMALNRCVRYIFSCQEQSKKYYYVVDREDGLKRQSTMDKRFRESEEDVADFFPVSAK